MTRGIGKSPHGHVKYSPERQRNFRFIVLIDIRAQTDARSEILMKEDAEFVAGANAISPEASRRQWILFERYRLEVMNRTGPCAYKEAVLEAIRASLVSLEAA